MDVTWPCGTGGLLATSKAMRESGVYHRQPECQFTVCNGHATASSWGSIKYVPLASRVRQSPVVTASLISARPILQWAFPEGVNSDTRSRGCCKLEHTPGQLFLKPDLLSTNLCAGKLRCHPPVTFVMHSNAQLEFPSDLNRNCLINLQC